MTPVADRVVLDTSVLLAATDEARAEHDRALAALDRWPASGTTPCTSGQILREYPVVATRPVDRKGLGLARPDAVANVRALRARLAPLAEDAKVATRLLEPLDRVACAGQQIHDANVVATMLSHGVDTVRQLERRRLHPFQRPSTSSTCAPEPPPRPACRSGAGRSATCSGPAPSASPPRCWSPDADRAAGS